MFIRIVSCVAIAGSAMTVTGRSQQVVTDRVACSACVVESRFRFAFRTEDAPTGLIDVPLQVARDHRGRYWVMAPGQMPLVFDAAGAFVREIGRDGAGPGEYRWPAHAASLPGDSVLIVDSQLQRVSVLGPDQAFVRAISLPFRVGPVAVLQWPNRVAMNAVVLTPDLAGWPLHFVDLSDSPGKLITSFGDNRGELRAGQAAALSRVFFGVDRESFWTSQQVAYRLARYSATGEVVETIQRRSEWFPDAWEAHLGSPTIPPPPHVRAVALRGDTAWVALAVARPDWKSAWERVTIPPSGELTRSTRPARTELYMTRIEVIDIGAGRLVAQQPIDGIVVFLDEDLTALVYTLEDDGTPQLSRVDLSLRNIATSSRRRP